MLLDSFTKAFSHPFFRERRDATVILAVGHIVLQPHAQLFVFCAFIYRPKEGKDLQLCVGDDDITRSVELQEKPVLPIGELEFDYAVGANLRDGADPPRPEELSEPFDKGRGFGCSRPSIFCKMAAEAAFDDKLLTMVGLVELE